MPHQQQQQQQKQQPVAWYKRTPAHDAQAAPDSSEEDEGDDDRGEGEEERESDQDTITERSPSLALAGTPSTTEGSKSPYSDMAVSNCMKSLSRLRCSAGEEESMQVSTRSREQAAFLGGVGALPFRTGVEPVKPLPFTFVFVPDKP
eukprot:1151431-Pelagomonas_calceolata.AAC.2